MNNNITINGNVTVNGSITFHELMERLGSVEKEAGTPTPKKLRETAGEPLARTEDGMILAYANGYAVYDNGCGRTVVWLPDCGEYTYRFQSEACDYMKHEDTVGDDVFGDEPWFLAVMVCGDHRVDDNMMNRTGSRKGTKEEKENCHGSREDAVDARMAGMFRTSEYGNPLDVVIRKETVAERLERMTERQREVFLMYHRDGYTQREIADMLGITQKAVDFRLGGAEKNIRKTN